MTVVTTAIWLAASTVVAMLLHQPARPSASTESKRAAGRVAIASWFDLNPFCSIRGVCSLSAWPRPPTMSFAAWLSEWRSAATPQVLPHSRHQAGAHCRLDRLPRRLSEAEVLLLGSGDRSFDGRYFGVRPSKSVIGPVKPIWFRPDGGDEH